MVPVSHRAHLKIHTIAYSVKMDLGPLPAYFVSGAQRINCKRNNFCFLVLYLHKFLKFVGFSRTRLLEYMMARSTQPPASPRTPLQAILKQSASASSKILSHEQLPASSKGKGQVCSTTAALLQFFCHLVSHSHAFPARSGSQAWRWGLLLKCSLSSMRVIMATSYVYYFYILYSSESLSY